MQQLFTKFNTTLLCCLSLTGHAQEATPQTTAEQLLSLYDSRIINESTQFEPLPILSLAAIGGTSEGPDEETSVNKDVLAKLNINETITAETTDLMGERIDLNTGALTFSQTDVSLPGNNNLSVAIHRTFKGGNYDYFNTVDMHDWMLDLPYIHTTLLKNKKRYSGDWGLGNECSGDLDPGSITHRGTTHESTEYWNGDTLNIPGRLHEKLLSNNGYLADSSSFPKVTKSNWRVACAKRADGLGEKFIVQAPNGDNYTFGELRLVLTKGLVKNRTGISRYHAFMLVTKVTDKYGNEVNYHYHNKGKLTSITSSDTGQTGLN
ncbi:MAG: hypothetical protein HRT38_12225 [Alteromonadaceae bacterium]|nr:hypothetical protein [Alteromonadaceae bacterium]